MGATGGDRRPPGRRGLVAGLVASGAALLGAFAGGASLAGAAAFEVTNTAGSGPGSLRQAILDANAAAGADSISFAPGVGGTIELGGTQLSIAGDLDIAGPGAGALTVSGQELSRVFFV